MIPLYIILTMIAVTQIFISYSLGKLKTDFDKIKCDYLDRIVFNNKMEAAKTKDAIICILLSHADSVPMPITQLHYRLMQCNIHCTIPHIKQHIEEINKHIPGIELTYNN